jgi:protein SCO1
MTVRIAAVVMTAAGVLQATPLAATPASPPAVARADDRLIDQYGHRVSPAELNGHWLLVYFGYADCPDLCPASLLRMRQLLDGLGAAGSGVVPVFVSVNPAADTPARLKAFAAQFHPRLRALTGSATAIADAARTFGVPVKRVEGRNLIDHGVFTYLAAPDGRVVATLHPSQPLSANLDQIRRAMVAPPPR